MWLLSTNRAELHYFQRSFDAIGGYAILSHTWDGNEQTLQQIRAIVERCRANGTNPRDDPELSSKIRECCKLAEKHGYHWVWIDSCCIDKTSSSELSEAINSMYKWYGSAEVCYAYLKDVPHDDDLEAPYSAFRKSRWHTRGWTLQELIAPDSVIFLSVDWREVGTRAQLAELLQEITRVPSGVLKEENRPAECSACRRMSWASRRMTTRVEDEAYCLMGLFGVSMPTNYGEGKQAFIRLQYEIMERQECDMSLFAFGDYVSLDQIIRDGIVFDQGRLPIDRYLDSRYLLASSPQEFRNSFGYIPQHLPSHAALSYPPPLVSTGPFDSVELPSTTATSYGVRLRVPVAIVDGITIAVILCQANNKHFGLFLTSDDRAQDLQRPRYFTGHSFTESATGSAQYMARMCELGDNLYNLTFNGQPFKASWQTIYVVPCTSHFYSERLSFPILRVNSDLASRFHIPRWLIDTFASIQFEVQQTTYTESLQVVKFNNRSRGRIYIALGTCTEHHHPTKPPLPWAKAHVVRFVTPESFTHNCSEDHLDSEPWATGSRVFGDEDRKARLSLMRSTRMSETATFVIHLEPFGRVFEEMLKEAGISDFPESPKGVKRDSSEIGASGQAGEQSRWRSRASCFYMASGFLRHLGVFTGDSDVSLTSAVYYA